MSVADHTAWQYDRLIRMARDEIVVSGTETSRRDQERDRETMNVDNKIISLTIYSNYNYH